MRSTMRGFTSYELQQVSRSFVGTYKHRDRSLFLLGIGCGAKITDLLSLTIADIDRYDVCEHLRNIGVSDVVLNRDCSVAMEQLLLWHHQNFGNLSPTRPLFPSRIHNNSSLSPITRQQAHRILKDACQRAGVDTEYISTHSMRITHKERLYCMEILNDAEAAPLMAIPYITDTISIDDTND